MAGYKENIGNEKSNNWIYIGADIHNLNFSKVGMTTNGLNTRHTSTQNPGYFIYTAFNIVNHWSCKCDVVKIEKELHDHLVNTCKYQRLTHFSTGSESECYAVNPDEITDAVENFIERYYGSCVTYENQLHGWMSRFQCDHQMMRRYQQPDNSKNIDTIPTSLSRTETSYFTGNEEEYIIDLGDGHYQDISTGLFKHIDDDGEQDEDI
ncbi:GIY-YIG nuclease family protein [Salmonella enterica]|nr:GIY-YIG nuclease family protein [Salmonella enterica]